MMRSHRSFSATLSKAAEKVEETDSMGETGAHVSRDGTGKSGPFLGQVSSLMYALSVQRAEAKLRSWG